VAGPEEVERAVEAAHRGLAIWSRMTGVERGRILARAAQILRARNSALADLETRNTGKPIQETSLVDIHSGADCLEYYAGLTPTITGDHIDLGNAFVYTPSRADRCRCRHWCVELPLPDSVLESGACTCVRQCHDLQTCRATNR
jgi:acyl-CoA reductase-like NAD-dependent aldehyde dehydrogenase